MGELPCGLLLGLVLLGFLDFFFVAVVSLAHGVSLVGLSWNECNLPAAEPNSSCWRFVSGKSLFVWRHLPRMPWHPSGISAFDWIWGIDRPCRRPLVEGCSPAETSCFRPHPHLAPGGRKLQVVLPPPTRRLLTSGDSGSPATARAPPRGAAACRPEFPPPPARARPGPRDRAPNWSATPPAPGNPPS
jgi:hypothetical protein